MASLTELELSRELDLYANGANELTYMKLEVLTLLHLNSAQPCGKSRACPKAR